jgi:DNA-binding CsgD family transcriptional regulator/PAS domain-containing protein
MKMTISPLFNHDRLMDKHAVDLKAYDALVSIIYEAANNPDRWDDFLAQIAQALSCRAAVLWLLDTESHLPSFSATYGNVETLSPELCANYFQPKPKRQPQKSLPEGTVVHRQEMASDKDYIFTEFYQNFFPHKDNQDIVRPLPPPHWGNAARIAMHRAESRKPFDERDRHFMSLLAPHLQRAFAISHRIQTIRAQDDNNATILNHLPFGVILLNRAGQPVTMNSQAEAMSRQCGGIRIKGDSLSASSPQDTQTLQQLIHQATQDHDGKTNQGGVLAISRRTSLLPLSVLVTPMNPAQALFGFTASQAAAAVFISDPAQQQEISPEILCGLYGLTQAEACLAKELAQGRSLDEISDLYQVSKHTTRAQLKSIFSKTGLKRQPDLVRLILGGPASLNL